MNGIEAVKNSCNAKIDDLTIGQTIASKRVCPEATDDAGDTTLEMSCPPASVDLNSIVTFVGKLTANDACKALGNVEIGIYEKDRSFMGDDLFVAGKTNKDGDFKIDWKAKQQDWWDDSVEVYARFTGDEKYKPSQTGIYRIRVLVHLKRKT